MRTPLIILIIGFTSAVLGPSCDLAAEIGIQGARSPIPYVATRNDAVQNMLWMADTGKDDVVFDLGSGDGRIAIAAVRDFGARRAVGIEIDPKRIQESRENARQAKVADRVEFIQGDMFAADIREATVVTLFVGHEPNLTLRPKMLRDLKPGARIVSHQFGMGEWGADKTLTVRTVFLGMYGETHNPFADNPHVPDYTGNEMHHGTSDIISTWIVPAPVAGVWRGEIETADGPHVCQLILHQRLSGVTGTLQISGQDKLSGGINADLWGNHLRFALSEYGFKSLRFDGHVNKDTMHGSLADDLHPHREWKAERDKVDLTGTWEWASPTGSRTDKLRVERRDGRLVATYLDRDKTEPIADFYDCGGGFYFTLLAGRSDRGGFTRDTGWLIGEAVLDRGELKGTIEFYPWAMPDIPGGKLPSPVIRNWTPRPVEP